MIAVPEFASGAMENWGLIGYRMRALLHDEEMSSLTSRSSVAMYISHELAHMVRLFVYFVLNVNIIISQIIIIQLAP